MLIITFWGFFMKRLYFTCILAFCFSFYSVAYIKVFVRNDTDCHVWHNLTKKFDPTTNIAERLFENVLLDAYQKKPLLTFIKKRIFGVSQTNFIGSYFTYNVFVDVENPCKKIFKKK